jgi:hypothetical protein
MFGSVCILVLTCGPDHQANHPGYTALGFLVTLYATLITLFGLAWVLFLIGMTPIGLNLSYRAIC